MLRSQHMHIPRKFRILTALGVAAIGAVAMVTAAAGFVGWALPAHERQVVNYRLASASHPVVSETIHRTISPQDVAVLAGKLKSHDPNIRHSALAQVRALAKTDRNSLVAGLANWVSPLLDAKQYKDVEAFGRRAILARPFDSAIVRTAQRARVIAFMAQANYTQALVEAKSYYNIASQAQTGDAIDLLSQILTKTNGPSAASRLEAEQVQSDTHSLALDSIRIDPKAYDNAIARLANPRNHLQTRPHDLLMARGNLLLLSGRPVEARQNFLAACQLEVGVNANLRQALESLVDSIRAEKGNAKAGEQFLYSLQSASEQHPEILAGFGSLKPEEVTAAARQLGSVGTSERTLPAPEIERERREGMSQAPASSIRVVSGFESSTPVYVTALSPTHLVVEITTSGYRDWFMFRLDGVAGTIVRIDITGAYKTVPEWSRKSWSLNPLYSYQSDTVAPKAFSPGAHGPVTVGNNGTLLPDTTMQNWHFLKDVWSDDYTLSFVQRFDSDSVYIAMRVPRTPSYNEHYFQLLALNPKAKVADLGRSAQKRPLLMAEIGTLGIGKPCVLLYAGEHADEEDVGWAAQGVIEFLLSDCADAIQLRQECTFLIVPTLDPDATAAGIHQGIISSFYPGRTTPESIAYANWFQNWIDSGHRLDLVIDLHNVQSSEEPHVSCPLIEGDGERGELCLDLHKLIIKNFQDAGYDVHARPTMLGWMPDRLGGWLSQSYGPLSIAYELNSQAPERHLSLAETMALGQVFAQSIGRFFSTRAGITAMTAVDKYRQERFARWDGRPTSPLGSNAIACQSSALALTTKESPELIRNSIP